MNSELPRWLQDDEDAEAPASPTPGRRWLLAGLAALPWVVVVGLLLTGQLAVPAASQADVPADDPPSASPPEPPQAPRSSTPSRSSTDLPAPNPSWTEEGAVEATQGHAPTEDHIGAVAIAVARAWLTDVGPQVQIEGLRPHVDRYLEQAVLETVDVRGGMAVATLLAVVLERDGEQYTDAVVHRLGVPIAVGESGAHPAGEPWWLPDPDLRPRVADLEAVDDPETALSLAEGLTEAGYGGVEIERVARHAGGWLVADVVARLPDGRALEGPVWLTDPGPVTAEHRPEDDHGHPGEPPGHGDHEHVPPRPEEQP